MMLFSFHALGQTYEFRIKIDDEMKKESDNIEHDTDKIPTGKYNILKLENGTSVSLHIHRSSILTLYTLADVLMLLLLLRKRNLISHM